MEFSVHLFTVEIRLAFDENWRPHLEGILAFLERRSIISGRVRRKDGFNTWHLVIARIASVKKLARELLNYSVKKRGELSLVIRYLDDEITAEEFVEGMNAFVRMGERTGIIKPVGPPYTHEMGKELSRRCQLPRVASKSFDSKG